jgi:hypothetical protein
MIKFADVQMDFVQFNKRHGLTFSIYAHLASYFEIRKIELEIKLPKYQLKSSINC